MIRPRRIDLELFEEDLKTLINTSAKIFPMSQDDIDKDINPNNYEYAKVGRKIYIWVNNKWDYVIADDIDIKYSDIKELPQEFNPKKHTHIESEIPNLDKYSKSEVDTKLSNKADKIELHNHSNKSILDTIVQALIDNWNGAYNHISDFVKHVTQTDKDKWNTVINKSDKTYVDTELLKKVDKSYVDAELVKKSDNTHNHDGAYYKKSEVDSKLSGKSDTTHTHNYSPTNHNHDTSYAIKSTENLVNDHEQRLFNIENGYTEGHSHPNVPLLNSITQSSVNAWNSISTHTHKNTDIALDGIGVYIRELPNGTKDEVRVVNGKAEYIQRNNKKILQASDVTGMSTSSTNLDFAYVVKPSDALCYNNMTTLGSVSLDGYSDFSTIAIDDINNIGKFSANKDATVLRVGFVKGTTLAQAREQLAGKALTYQLAQEQIYNISLKDKSDIGHTHLENDITNLDKYTKTEIDTKLLNKSDTNHVHSDKADKAYVDTELAKKVNSTTFEGHTGSTSIHVTQLDKDKWNAKSDSTHIHDASEITFYRMKDVTIESVINELNVNIDAEINKKANLNQGVTIGSVKPTDKSIWYEVIG